MRGGLPRGGFSLAAFLVRTKSDALTAASADNPAAAPALASRVRTALEGSRTLRFARQTLAPSVELGVRQDGGDAQTGLGLKHVETRVDEIRRDIGELRDRTRQGRQGLAQSEFPWRPAGNLTRKSSPVLVLNRP